MKTKSMIMILFFHFITSCNSQRKDENKKIKNNIEKTEINIKNKDSIIDKMNKVLIRQIEFGNSVSNDVTDIKYYEFNIDDIEILEDECLKILLSNGYIVPTEEKFDSRVNSIFNKLHSNENLFYINLFDICKKVSSFSDSDGFRPNLFISKTKKLIVDQLFIAEITNYEELYPDIIDIEKKINTKFIDDIGDNIYVTKWKDVKDLAEQRKKNIKTIIARNMYLFNDSRAYFTWLILNDKNFMRSLVTTFGYYDDKELLKWLVEQTEFTNQNIDEVNKIIYNKKCDGKIVFDQQLLNILSEDDAKAIQFYEFIRYYYIDWLLSGGSNTELTFSQKAEIIARIHSFIYTHNKEYRTVDFMGKFAEYNDSDNKYSKEFRLKNYYNIPEFEKQWKQAKIDGDGISLPGEE